MKTMPTEKVRMSYAQFPNLLEKLQRSGKIFTAEFIKRDNSVRIMNCRMGVKKYVKGVGLKFSPKEKGLLPVYDLQKKEYRFVNLNTITWLRFAGKIYYFN